MSVDTEGCPKQYNEQVPINSANRVCGFCLQKLTRDWLASCHLSVALSETLPEEMSHHERNAALALHQAAGLKRVMQIWDSGLTHSGASC